MSRANSRLTTRRTNGRTNGRTNQRRTDPAIQKEAQRRSLKRMGRVLMFAVVIAVIGGGAAWLNQKWSVRHWEIKAETPIRVAIESQMKNMPSRDFLSTRPELLRRQWLQHIPDLAAVSITRILPGRLQIQADARVPVALWQDEQSRLHLFDATGHVYRLLRRGESPDLPLLRVPASQLSDVQKILETLAQNDASPLSALSEIRASGGDWQIYFNRGVSWMIPQSNAGAVIDRIILFLKQPRWRHRYWRVDARLASRWFIRPVGHGGVI